MIRIEPQEMPAAAEISRARLSRYLLRARRAVRLEGQVDVLLTDDKTVKRLNRDFRGKNKATDVLSFPAGDFAEGMVGDLAVSLDTAAKQAKRRAAATRASAPWTSSRTTTQSSKAH